MEKSVGKASDTAAAKGRRDYFQGYYEENRDGINRKRKRRYHSDPEYKESVLNSSQRYRDKHRTAPKIRLPRYSLPSVEKAGDGSEIKLFSVGAFATFLNRSVQAITHWEKGGVLPQTPYRDSRGHRFYTKEMMVVVRDVVGERRRLYPVEGINEKIRHGWVDLGVPMGAKTMEAALAKTKAVVSK